MNTNPDRVCALRKRLAELSAIILDPANNHYQLRPEIQEMQSIFIEARGPVADIEHPTSGETITPNGLAVSPRWAEMCMDDTARTIQFQRGLSASINEVCRRGEGRPVRVLYAGCGPFATLAVPLMAVLSPDEVQFTFIDLHPQSIRSAKALIGTLGYDAFVDKFLVQDAFEHTIAEGAAPDIVLLEVMQCCLNKEPQVALARHFLVHAPNALMVPKRIEVNLVDLVFDQDKDDGVGAATTSKIACIFYLDKAAIKGWTGIVEDTLPAASVNIPVREALKGHLHLETVIETYDGNMLSGFDSGLTVPQMHAALNDAPFGQCVRFGYRLGDAPTLFVSEVIKRSAAGEISA